LPKAKGKLEWESSEDWRLKNKDLNYKRVVTNKKKTPEIEQLLKGGPRGVKSSEKNTQRRTWLVDWLKVG